MSAVITKFYDEPEISVKEILRYAGAREADGALLSMLRECIEDARGVLSYKACFLEAPLSVSGDICDFSFFSAKSKNLAKNLHGCSSVVIFAATVGIGIDRLIHKYSTLSPAKALLYQAIGAERIEALCDTFCDDIKSFTKACRNRFSAGYGDLALETQKEIFKLLSPEKNIGLTLGESLLMSPTKSVSAFIGIEK